MNNEIFTLPTISFIGGNSKKFEFNTFFYSNKEKFDLSDCSVRLSIIDYVNKTGEPIVTKDATIISDQSEPTIMNTIVVELSPEDTIDLHGKYIYQISILSEAGEMEIPGHGIMYIMNNIDKDFYEQLSL